MNEVFRNFGDFETILAYFEFFNENVLNDANFKETRIKKIHFRLKKLKFGQRLVKFQGDDEKWKTYLVL